MECDANHSLGAGRLLSPDRLQKIWIEWLPAATCRVDDHCMQSFADIRALLGDGQAAIVLGLVPAPPYLADVGGGGQADALGGQGMLQLLGPELPDPVLQRLDST